VSRLVDRVPTDQEVEAYARSAHRCFASHQARVGAPIDPLWDYLRHDLKSFWLGQARVTLSVYAYGHNPIEVE
jgi:hypothetical protein